MPFAANPLFRAQPAAGPRNLTPPVYRANNSVPVAGAAQRQTLSPPPAHQRVQAPPVYRPQQAHPRPAGAAGANLPAGAAVANLPAGAAGANLPAGYVQRKAAGSGIIQRQCALCGGNEQPGFDANGDLVNGHAYGCIRYHRTFQTAHDRAATLRTGIFQRSHSFRASYQPPPSYDASGLYVVPPPVIRRVHQHDNNASGGAPVVHYR